MTETKKTPSAKPDAKPGAKSSSKPRVGSKSPRRRAREFALQGLYSYLLNQDDLGVIDAQLRGMEGYDKADKTLLSALLKGVVERLTQLEAVITTKLDREVAELSPVERAVLLIATLELTDHIEVPYRVVINEAIELAKSFGGTDGHRYVNGVLDKLALQLRPHETAAKA